MESKRVEREKFMAGVLAKSPAHAEYLAALAERDQMSQEIAAIKGRLSQVRSRPEVDATQQAAAALVAGVKVVVPSHAEAIQGERERIAVLTAAIPLMDEKLRKLNRSRRDEATPAFRERFSSLIAVGAKGLRAAAVAMDEAEALRYGAQLIGLELALYLTPFRWATLLPYSELNEWLTEAAKAGYDV